MNLMSLPLLAADLTFARVRHGRVYSAMSDWEEDRDPVVGETVLVADGEGQPFEAKIERIDPDWTIVLTVRAFAA
jgi:transcription antitermination factor NusG